MQTAPWSLIGTYIEDKDPLKQRELAGLGWSLDLREIAYRNKLNKWKIDNTHLALVRADTDHILNIVGSGYTEIDIHQIIRLARDLPGTDLSYAWCLDGGETVGIAKRQPKTEQGISPFFHIYTTFLGKSALKVDVVYVLSNGVVIPLGMDTSISVRHKNTSEVNIQNISNNAERILQECNSRLFILDKLDTLTLNREKVLDILRKSFNCHSAIKGAKGRQDLILGFFILNIGNSITGLELFYLICEYWDKHRKCESPLGRWNLIMRKESLGYSHKDACLKILLRQH